MTNHAEGREGSELIPLSDDERKELSELENWAESGLARRAYVDFITGLNPEKPDLKELLKTDPEAEKKFQRLWELRIRTGEIK